MVPIGWTKMECPRTREVQPRKVAKIVQDRNVDYWRKRNNDEIKIKDEGTGKFQQSLKKQLDDDS